MELILAHCDGYHPHTGEWHFRIVCQCCQTVLAYSLISTPYLVYLAAVGKKRGGRPGTTYHML